MIFVDDQREFLWQPQKEKWCSITAVAHTPSIFPAPSMHDSACVCVCIGLVSYRLFVKVPVKLNCPECLLWFAVRSLPFLCSLQSMVVTDEEAEDREKNFPQRENAEKSHIKTFQSGNIYSVQSSNFQFTYKHLCIYKCICYLFILSIKYSNNYILYFYLVSAHNLFRIRY